MLHGIPYDSDAGRAIAGALTAILCGHAYKVSAEMAAAKGPFDGFAKNREPMLRVMGMHRDAAYAIDRDHCPEALFRAACADWDDAVDARPRARLPQRAGDRARADRHHRPPDGLRHDRHRARLLAGEVQEARGRRLLQDRQPVGARGAPPPRLRAEPRCRRSSPTSPARTRCSRAPHVNRATLKQKGLTDDDLAKIEAALPGVFDLELAFGPWVLGDEAYDRLGVGRGAARAPRLLAPQAPRLHRRPRSRRRTRRSSAG